MLVGERMSHPVISVSPKMPMQEAHKLMRDEKIRRLPVVNERGKMIGIITESDLLHASPSDATSLSVWEMNYMLSKVTVEKIMTREVITTQKDTPLEEAARKMVDNRIGGLPVVMDGEVIGIITETDLFKVFLEMLGARESGVRISVLISNIPGTLTKLTKSIFDSGGNLVALGTFMGESTENREITLKVTGVDKAALEAAVKDHVERIVDIRESIYT
ncbi:MAG: CBS domain-containing protein [Anaerolineales bacterium]|jgi:acetoin utilization protein AcuB